MNILFITTYSLWFVSEIILNRLLRSKKTDKQNVDKGSVYFIWIIIIISIPTAIYISNKYFYPILRNSSIEYFGLSLIFLGIILRLIIIKSLGNFFTVNVTIKSNHILKKDGFYKYLRHPSYASSILSFIGFGISLNNLFSLVLILTLIFITFVIRIKVEEKVLIEHFGSEYLDYIKTTKKIIPFIY